MPPLAEITQLIVFGVLALAVVVPIHRATDRHRPSHISM